MLDARRTMSGSWIRFEELPRSLARSAVVCGGIVPHFPIAEPRAPSAVAWWRMSRTCGRRERLSSCSVLSCPLLVGPEESFVFAWRSAPQLRVGGRIRSRERAGRSSIQNSPPMVAGDPRERVTAKRDRLLVFGGRGRAGEDFSAGAYFSGFSGRGRSGALPACGFW